LKVLILKLILFNSVKLDGCVVCNNAKIMEKSVLKDCEVGGGYVVVTESTYHFNPILLFITLFADIIIHVLAQAKNEQLVEFRDLS
jgi:hypothetical protein